MVVNLYKEVYGGDADCLILVRQEMSPFKATGVVQMLAWLKGSYLVMRHTVARNCLWAESIQGPLVGTLFLGVCEPVMESALAALPELDQLGYDPEPAPEFWNWNFLFVLEPLLGLTNPALELLSAVVILAFWLENLALPAGPGTDPTPAHAGVKVLLAFLSRDPARLALDADLALQALPPKGQTGPRVGSQVGGLATRPKVAVDDEALGVKLFEVDHAGRDTTGRQRGGGQAARLGVGNGIGLLRRGEPEMELPDRARGIQVGTRKNALLELLGLALNLFTGGGDCGLCK